MRKWLVGLAAASVGLTAPLQAQDVAVYKPSGPWVADYGDDYCRLGRVFSDGQNDLELGIERVRPGEQVRIWVIGDSLKTFRGAEDTGYTFLPAQSERTLRPIRSTRGAVNVLSLPEVTLAPLAPPVPGARPTPRKYDPAQELAVAKGITAIALGKGLTRPVRFETGPLDGPIGALQTCTDDLVKSWGVDPAAQRALATPAIPQGLPWLPAGTVGFGDFANLAGNNNMFRLLINAEGKPTDCHVNWVTLNKALNDKICATLMEKAAFTPAKNAAGQAVASYWTGSPMFLMPAQGGRR